MCVCVCTCMCACVCVILRGRTGGGKDESRFRRRSLARFEVPLLGPGGGQEIYFDPNLHIIPCIFTDKNQKKIQNKINVFVVLRIFNPLISMILFVCDSGQRAGGTEKVHTRKL